MRELKSNGLNYGCSSDFNGYFINTIGALPYESLCASFLDAEMNVLAVVELGSGSSKSVTNDITDILYCSESYSSRRVVLCHNHPDGRTKPSEADIFETDRLKRILENSGIILLDHLIVTAENVSSVFFYL